MNSASQTRVSTGAWRAAIHGGRVLGEPAISPSRATKALSIAQRTDTMLAEGASLDSFSAEGVVFPSASAPTVLHRDLNAIYADGAHFVEQLEPSVCWFSRCCAMTSQVNAGAFSEGGAVGRGRFAAIGFQKFGICFSRRLPTEYFVFSVSSKPPNQNNS